LDISQQTTETAEMSTTPSRGLHIGLWVVQGLLAFGFVGAGVMKLVMPVDELAASMPWIEGQLGGLVRFIGLAEVLGALGLIVPAATKIKPMLTPLAAVGLLLVMILALGTHIARAEYAAVAPPIVLGGLAAFVAWGRLRKAPIEAR
jgi:putative oxidoreductase